MALNAGLNKFHWFKKVLMLLFATVKVPLSRENSNAYYSKKKYRLNGVCINGHRWVGFGGKIEVES